MGLGAIFSNFVWEMARLGAVFNFNFRILHAKVAKESLIIWEHLGRYLREF